MHTIEVAIFTDDTGLGETIAERFPTIDYELNAAVGGTMDVLSILAESASVAISVIGLLFQLRAGKKVITINHITVTSKGRTKRIVVSALSEDEVVAVLRKMTKRG